MNLWRARRYRFYIHRRGEFWTGRAWTTIAQFGKPFEFNAALAVIQKRFSSTRPAPKIRHCRDFHAKPKPPKPPTKAQVEAKKKAEKKAAKKAEKKAQATGNGRRRKSDGASGRLPAV